MTAPAAILVWMRDSLTPMLRRSLDRTRWRDLRYLLVAALLAPVASVFLSVAGPVTFGLSFALIGLPLAGLVARIDRGWCALERARAAMVLDRPVPPRYTTPSGGNRLVRWMSVLGDRQTWLDGLWMAIIAPLLGILALLLLLISWPAVLGLLSAPIWLWSIPGWIHAHVVFLSIAFPLLALPAALLAGGLIHAGAIAHASLAATTLGQSPNQALRQRVRTLAETRAGAFDASISELQRVERDLHDGAQARLVALAMDLGLAEQRLAGADPESALEHVANARGQARAAMAELRDLVRGIGPSILTDRGLDAALTALVAGQDPPVELRVELSGSEVGARETAAYFVVAEALTNARKHARADRITVHVWQDAGRSLRVEVSDDGVGGADPGAGSGLVGLRKRLAALDGTLTLVSPPGGPTTVRAELP